jgi:hypothetical protein
MAIVQDEKSTLVKVTNKAWRSFWFLFYMVIAPATCILLSYWLSGYFSRNLYFAINFTTVITIVSLFFFYRFFDKYLQTPLLKNDLRNLSFHINIPFLLSVVSMGSTFAIDELTPLRYHFQLLPVILFGIVYNISWYYLKLKPIDIIDYENNAFKNKGGVAEWGRLFHNNVLIMNFFFQLFFMFFYIGVGGFWVTGFVLNAVFWVVAARMTSKSRAAIVEGIKTRENVDDQHVIFQRQYCQAMVGLCFSFIVAIAFYPIASNPIGTLRNAGWMVNFFYGIVVAVVLFLKAEVYTYSYFSRKLTRLQKPDAKIGTMARPAEAMAARATALNVGATMLLVVASLVIAFIQHIQYVTFGVSFLAYCMIFGERKAKMYGSTWFSISHVLATTCAVASIVFWVFPFQWYALLAIFIVVSYFMMEIYVRVKYFLKFQVIRVLDALAIASFCIVAADSYPGIALAAKLAVIGPVHVLVAMASVAMLLASIAFYCSISRLYVTLFQKRTSSGVKATFSVSFILIVAFSLALVINSIPITTLQDILNAILWSSICVSIIFIMFAGVVTYNGIFFPKNASSISFYTSIVPILSVPALIFCNFPVAGGILTGALVITVELGYYLRIGTNSKRVSTAVYIGYMRVARPLLVGELFTLQLALYLSLSVDIVLSIYLSTIITTFILNIFSATGFLDKRTVQPLNMISLLFTSAVICNYLLDVTAGSAYIFVLPGIVTTLFTFLPIYYGFRIGWFNRAFPPLMFVNGVLLAVFVLLVPTAVMLDLASRGIITFDLFSDFFYTFILSFLAFSTFNVSFRSLKIKASYLLPFAWGMVVSMTGVSVFGAISLYNLLRGIQPSSLLPTFQAISILLLFTINFLTVAIISGYKLLGKTAVVLVGEIVFYGFAISLWITVTLLMVLRVNLLYSMYFSTVIITIFLNLFSRTRFYIKQVVQPVNIISLLFTSAVICNALLAFTAGSVYIFVLPGILTTLFTFLPIYYGFRIGWFKRSYPYLAFVNGILLAIFVLLVPTTIMLDMESRGIITFDLFSDLFYTFILSFLAFSTFNASFRSLKIKASYLIPFTWGMVVSMAGVSAFGAISLYNILRGLPFPALLPTFQAISILLLFTINFVTFAILSGYKMLGKTAVVLVGKLVYYGFTVSLSTTITLLVEHAVPLTIFPENLESLAFAWYLLVFFTIALILSVFLRHVTPNATQYLVEKLLSAFCWFYLEILGLLLVSGYVSNGGFVNIALTYGTLLMASSPVTCSLLKQTRINLDTHLKFIKGFVQLAFLAFGIACTIDRVWALPLTPILLVSINCGIYAWMYLTVMKNGQMSTSKFLAGALVIFLAFTYLGTPANIPFLFIVFIILKNVGKVDGKMRGVRTIFLAQVTFTTILVIQSGFSFPLILLAQDTRSYLVEYTICLIIALIYSITTTTGKKSHVEGNIILAATSLLLFQALLEFTPVSLFHAVNITCIVYLAVLGLYLFTIGAKKYAIALKLCVISIVIYVTSGICTLVFVRPGLETINNSMTFLATYSTVAFVIIGFLRDLMPQYKKYALGPMLFGFNIFVPAFFYLLFTYYISTSLESAIILLISIDIGFFLSFLSIGVYHWKLSKEVWKIGWWLWMIFPVVNFYIIFKATHGVDVLTALNFFSIGSISGSGIITLVMVSAMYLPIIQYKVKKYYYPFMFVLWGESLLIVGWVSQNLFPTNVVISAITFLLFGTWLILPLLYKLKAWKVLAVAWSFLIACNVVFLYVLLEVFLVPLGFILPIELISASVLALVYAYIPFAPGRHVVAISAVTSLFSGMFLLIYYIFYLITGYVSISINIAFIAIGFGLFSSRHFPVNQRTMRAVIAVILMVNSSLLVSFSIDIVPGVPLLAVFFGLAVFGGTFYTANHYWNIFHIDRRVPWTILGTGTSLSITELLFTAWKAPPMVLCFTLSLVMLLFFFKQLPNPVRIIVVPLPVTFLFEEIVLLAIPSGVGFAILFLSFIYTLLFQACLNHYVKSTPAAGQQTISNEPLSSVKVANAVLFIVNATEFSMIVAWMSRLIIVMFLLLPVLLLACLHYIKKLCAGKHIAKLPIVMNIFSGILDLLVVSSITTLILTPILPAILPLSVASFVTSTMTFSFVLFLEILVLDAALFKLLTSNARNVIIFASYLIAFNLIGIYLYLFYLNVFLLSLSICLINILPTWFLQKMDARYIRRATIAMNILIYGAMISTALLVSLWISLALVQFNVTPVMVSWLIFFMDAFLFIFILNFLVSGTIPKSIVAAFKLVIFLGFQAFLMLVWLASVNFTSKPWLLSLLLLSFIETTFAFYPYYAIKHQLLHEDLKRKDYNPLIALQYLELALLIYAISSLALGPLESVQLALITLLLFTLVEFFAVKSIKVIAVRVLNLISYLIAFNIFGIYLYQSHSNPFLLSLCLCVINILPTWFWQKIDAKHLRQATITRNVLINGAMISTALLFSSWISLALVQFNVTPVMLSLLTFFMDTFLFIFILDLVFYRAIPKSITTAYRLAVFLGFQAFLVLVWLASVNFTSKPGVLSLLLLLFVETSITYYPYFAIRHQILHQGLKREDYSPLITLQYFELAMVVYAVSNFALGVLLSMQLALICLLFLTFVELYAVRSIKGLAARLLNLLAYVLLTLSFLAYAIASTSKSYGLLMLAISAFVALQQYTNYAVFRIIKAGTASTSTMLEKAKTVTKRVIGIVFYAFIFLSIQGFMAGLNWLIQFLLLSVVLFVLALIDRGSLNFLGKVVSTVAIEGCWFLFSAGIAGGVVILLIKYTFLIPLLFLVIDFEIAVGVLFIKGLKIASFDAKIKTAWRVLLLILELSISTWPLFFWMRDVVMDAVLVLVSWIFFEILFRFGMRMVRDIVRIAVVHVIDMGLCIWLSVIFFALFQEIHMNVVVSALIAEVICIALLDLSIHPFAAGGRVKNVYWSLFSISCGVLTYVLLLTFVPVLSGRWYVELLSGVLVTFLLLRVILTDTASTPTGAFILNIIYYITIYGTIIGVIFGFMKTTFVLPTSLLAVIIFGAILSGIIYFYEKRGVISIKYRLISSVSLIVLILAFIAVVLLEYLKVIPPI